MQTIYLDISNKGVVPTVYAKQKEVGRKFAVILTDSGLPYIPEVGSVFSVWYKGASGEGNYTDIGDKPAFSLSGNKVEVEMIVQMLFNHGDGTLCLTLNSLDGNQISSWNIPYMCEIVPGSESEKAEEYYTAFSKAVEKLPYPDASLSVHGKAADAAAVGTALSGKAPAGYGLGEPTGRYASDLNAAITGGLWWTNADTKNLPSSAVTDSIVFVKKRLNGEIVQEIQSMDGNKYELTRWSTDGGATWRLEWKIPPMLKGVEYRTTERYDGKPVYIKLCDLGALPNATTKTYDGLADYVDRVVDATLNNSRDGGASYQNAPEISWYVGSWGTPYVSITTSTNMSDSTARITLKYTKTTD